MNFHQKFALGPLVLLLFVLTPASAFASRTATVVRTRAFTYRDRTPRIHSTAPKPQHHHTTKN
jgi:hypothetical protein